MKRVTTEYKVNEAKRTVVCIITTINDVPHRLAKYGLADEEYDEIDYDVRIYKGIAKCAPEDEWNEAYGKHLAEYRASKLRQSDVNNEIKKYNLDDLITVDDGEYMICGYGCLQTMFNDDRTKGSEELER